MKILIKKIYAPKLFNIPPQDYFDAKPIDVHVIIKHII